MQVPIIKIGNSKGIRINKAVLEQYNLNDSLEMILEKSQIILRPLSKPRSGWDEAFEKMHQNGDDELLLPDHIEGDEVLEW
jgi:antitoxin MazE